MRRLSFCRFCLFTIAAILLFAGWKYRGLFNISDQIIHVPFFRRHRKVASVNCQLLINGNKQYIERLAKHRINLTDGNQDQSVSRKTCTAIRTRRFFAMQSASVTEEDFPIAFVRIVYQNYLAQEMLLSAMYTPQNLYGYIIDSKSSTIFKQSMHILADCFPNVFIVSDKLSIDRSGRNMTRGFLVGMARMLKVPVGWRYLITLQNDDIPLKTNGEMVQILTALNGSNDLRVTVANADRIPSGFDWSYRALRIFRNEDRYGTMENQTFQFAKGDVQSSLSRAFVQFLFIELNLDELLRRLDKIKFGADEVFFPSIDADSRLNAPGGFTRECLKLGNKIGLITKFTSWNNRNTCASGYFRHSTCVFGVEDLVRLQTRLELFANKLLTEFDFAALSCQLEALHNRSRLAFRTYPVHVYTNRTRSRYHRWKSEGGDRSKKIFDCGP